jgi:hypothetical protein
MHSLVQVCSAVSRVSVPPCSFSLIFQGSITIPARTATARWRVPYSLCGLRLFFPRIAAHTGAAQMGITSTALPVHLTVFWRNVEYPVPPCPSVGVRDRINRCENLLWLSMHFVAMILSGFVHSHAYDVRYELKIDIPSLVNCNGPVSPEKSEQSGLAIDQPGKFEIPAQEPWERRQSGTMVHDWIYRHGMLSLIYSLDPGR